MKVALALAALSAFGTLLGSAPGLATIRAAAAHRSPVPSRGLNGITLPDARISLRYPFNWYVTTRRLDYVVDPHTLVTVASYVIPRNPGSNCDGTTARGRPRDGAIVLIKELLDGASLRRSLPRLPPRPRHFHLPMRGRAGCLPAASAVFDFKTARRAFYVYVSIGPEAPSGIRHAVERLLDTMSIAPHR